MQPASRTRIGIRTVTAVATFLIAAVALAACGGDDDSSPTPTTGASPSPDATGTVDPSATPPRQDIDVLDIGIWNESGEGGQSRTRWVAIVRNKNADLVVRDSKITMLVYDASNALLTTSTENLAVLLPSQSLPVGGVLPAFNGTPSRVSVQPEAGGTDKPAATLSPWPSAPAQVTGTGNAREITGTVVNPLSAEVRNVTVACVAFAADSTPVAYGIQALDRLAPGGSAQVTCAIGAPSSTPPARASLYVLLSGMP